MFVFCGTIMAVQVDRQSWPFSSRRIFRFKEEDEEVLLVQTWFTTEVKYIFEYLRKHEECLIYVANMSVFWGCFNV